MSKTTELTGTEKRAIKRMLVRKRRYDAAKASYDAEREAIQKMMTRGGDTTFRYDEEDDFKVAISNIRPEPVVLIDHDSFMKRLKRRKNVKMEDVYTPVVTWVINHAALDELKEAGTITEAQIPKRTVPAPAAHVSVRITAK